MNTKEMTLKEFTDALKQKIEDFMFHWQDNEEVWPNQLPLAEWREQFEAYCEPDNFS